MAYGLKLRTCHSIQSLLGAIEMTFGSSPIELPPSDDLATLVLPRLVWQWGALSKHQIYTTCVEKGASRDEAGDVLLHSALPAG